MLLLNYINKIKIIEKMDKIKIDQDCSMISIDVIHLYNSIPKFDALKMLNNT